MHCRILYMSLYNCIKRTILHLLYFKKDAIYLLISKFVYALSKHVYVSISRENSQWICMDHQVYVHLTSANEIVILEFPETVYLY